MLYEANGHVSCVKFTYYTKEFIVIRNYNIRQYYAARIHIDLFYDLSVTILANRKTKKRRIERLI